MLCDDGPDFQGRGDTDPILACILTAARKEKLSVAGTQAAVWIYTDHLTFREMNTRMGIGMRMVQSGGCVARCRVN